MFDTFVAFLSTLNSLSPLAVIALLGSIIFLMVHKSGPIRKLSDNHLEHVQGSLDKIVDSTGKSVDLLVDMKSDLSYLKGKLDK